MIAAYIFWRSTQKLLSLDVISNTSIIDKVHIFVKPINDYLRNNPKIASYNFILSSLLIDINVLYVGLRYVFGDDDNNRTITILFSGFIFRQICQYINRLPYPKNLIWFDPGFPSLFVTYHVDSDFFFSGHTLIAITTGIDIISNPDIVSKIYGTFFITYEILFIIFTYSHYFMDIYAAITTYVTVVYFYDHLL